jgi:CTP:molybdopterin cytidylyltransferase MocA
MRTVALVIANDPGTGFEGSKYVSSDRGASMIERVVAKAESWPVDEVVVVLGPDADQIIANTGLGEATLVIDPEWAEGIAASLRVAIDLIMRGPATDRIVVALADQPGVDDATIEALLDRWGGKGAVVPKYRYRRGWPVVLSSDLFDLVLGMEGAADLHDVLQTHAEDVEEVMFDRLEPTRVLTPSDLRSGRTSG